MGSVAIWEASKPMMKCKFKGLLITKQFSHVLYLHAALSLAFISLAGVAAVPGNHEVAG